MCLSIHRACLKNHFNVKLHIRQHVRKYIKTISIWAIGTGKTATADQAEEVCKEIRDYIRSLYDDETADAVRIQYGGSVKSENAREILGEPNIDGALVGGASLVVDEFIDIIKAANEVSA